MELLLYGYNMPLGLIFLVTCIEKKKKNAITTFKCENYSSAPEVRDMCDQRQNHEGGLLPSSRH